MKLKYQCKIQKTAGIQTPKGFQPVGIFEEMERKEDVLHMTVKLFDKIPEELMSLIKAMPEAIQMQEQKLPGEAIILIP